MAEPPAAGAGKETKDKKEAKRLEEEEKRLAKLREETVKREAKQKEKEAKEREKEKEKEQKRLEKEAKEQEAREKELKRKEAKQKEEEAKREAKLKKEEAEREKKLKEKMEKLEKAKKGKSPREDKVRRHSKYRLSGGSTSGVDGSAKVIGSPLALVMHTKPDGSTELPQLFVAGINFLQDHLNTEGLFRISGSMQEINTWRGELDLGRELTFNPNTNPHSVAGILKLFLRELPEPLFTFSLYADWCTVAETPVANKQQRLQLIAEMLPKMPKANLLLLTELIRLLSAVVVFSAENKMTSANLGLVFGPNVMRGPDEGSMNLMYTCDVISFLIDNSAAFISIAGGGASIVETGEVAEAEEQAEAEPTEEEPNDTSMDGSHAGGSNVGGSQVGGGSHRSETSPVIASAPPAASEQGMPPLTLLPPPMDAPPPPPPVEEL